ncbi:MAG: malate dehydrogenase (oxaloacetate-decarboxylating)(NADP+) [Myxococcota bacterium]|jgi:malate dehydrogenase (oxaloacetate-decarboxylating)(NADP+)
MAERDEALAYHEAGRPGKIEVIPTKPLNTQRDLSMAYSPGVAWACRAIHDNPQDVFRYTAKGNLVAVVTNGSAVLGLGDIGPLASKPVMEGKANLFKKFADIDVFDIELDAPDAESMVAAVKAIAPTFGGINLEDIKAPECFEVERRLQEELDIPVFHDDQHGTAIISAAALINSCEITDRELDQITVVFSGAGAAAIACARLYMEIGVKRENIVMCDREGVITRGRANLFSEKEYFATDRELSTLKEALVGADVFIGLSIGNIMTPDMLEGMSPRPIVFAMANPDPEIAYELAKEVRPDAILATGRSDHPNQVNNVLGFPFVFRGALDCRARKVTVEMKVAATRAIAELAKADVPDTVLKAYNVSEMKFGPEYIIPKPFDPRVLLYVAPAVAEAAERSGVAREPIADLEAYRDYLHRLVERSRGLMEPLIRRARSTTTKRRIVFTDGDNPKVIRAAAMLVDERICTPVLLGPASIIQARADDHGVDLAGMEIDECSNGPLFDKLAADFWKMRQRKGVTRESAKAFLSDRAYYAAMLLRAGLADGMVGGPGRPYKYTLRPALRALGLQSESARASGVYVILAGDRKIFIGDCTVNIAPTAQQLAEIALNTARVATTFGEKPRVAMLSYSDFGEHDGDADVARVQEAVGIVRSIDPELEIEGEMQGDTAVNWEKHSQSFPFSRLTASANVLVFPNLTSGNIAYKLLENLASLEALGPLLVGVGAPVNVVPINGSVSEIFNVTTYTVTQALDWA